MNTANFLRLVLLAAIWGSSFLFMRIAAPVLGPAVLIEYRVAFAAIFLLAVGLLLKKRLDLRANWKHYLMLGMFNSALPFLLFAFAARTLTASVLSVLNATAPMWGALIAALAAAFCYSVASAYTKTAKSVEPFANAHGSMWAAALLVIPALPFFPAPAEPTAGIMAAALALGIMCSGIAYILYFRLIHDVGPTSALTVTFLSPLFGILWGAIFLHEVIGWYTIAGSAIVITGTALVTGFRPNFGARAVAPAPTNCK